MKNNNQSIINKLIFKSLFKHKTRSLLTMVSIIITCIMLTSVFTISMSLLKSDEHTKALRVGTLSHASFKQVTDEQIEKIKRHPLVKSYGFSTIIGLVEDDKLVKRPIEIRTMDDKYMADGFVEVKGQLPQARDEVVIDTITMGLLNLEGLGDIFEVKMKIGNDNYTETFKVVGIYDANIFSQVSYMIVSEKMKAAYVTEEVGPNFLGAQAMTINFNSKFGIERKMHEIMKDLDMPVDTKIGVNWAYFSDIVQIQPSDLMTYIMFILMLMFSGYLIIYNIYLIAITKDINFYGLLKTIGATSKQIKKIVYHQALILYLISLPIGLFLGYLIGVVLVPVVMKTLNVVVIAQSSHIGIFIAASLTSLLTVLYSCRKPAKLASRVSAIEAIRSVDTVQRKGKRRKRKNSIASLAWHNLFRVKKKAFLVIVSLSLSLLILSGVFITINTFDVNAHLNKMIGSDYLIANAEYFHYRNNGAVIPEDLMEELKKENLEVHQFRLKYDQIILSDQVKRELLSEVTGDQSSNFGVNRLHEGTLGIEQYSVDPYMLDILRDLVVAGEIPDQLGPNQIIIEDSFFSIVGFRSLPFNLGDSLRVGDKDYEIVAIVDRIPLYLYDQSFSQYSLQTFVKDDPSTPPMTLMVNGDMEAIRSSIEKKYPKLVIKSRQDYIDHMRGYLSMVRIVGYTLSSILALVGLLNFFNMMSTNILIRKRELAMMQSIGMTSKQVKKMLYLEGLYLVLIAAVISTIGSFFVGHIIENGLVYNHLGQMFSVMVVYFSLILLIPHMTYQSMAKESVVSRLSFIE